MADGDADDVRDAIGLGTPGRDRSRTPRGNGDEPQHARQHPNYRSQPAHSSHTAASYQEGRGFAPPAQLPAAVVLPAGGPGRGLPRIRFHDLRHSAATLLLGLGIHPKIVSELLGHSQVGIALALYSHVTATMQQETVRAFEGLLGSQPDTSQGQHRSQRP